MFNVKFKCMFSVPLNFASSLVLFSHLMKLFLFPIKFDYGSTFAAALVETSELVTNSSPVAVDPSHFHGTLHRAKSENDQNSWSAPGGEKFMIRGKTYLTDYTKVGCMKGALQFIRNK